jgi:hypothetical protein
MLKAGYLEDWTYHDTLSDYPPYAQCRVMRTLGDFHVLVPQAQGLANPDPQSSRTAEQQAIMQVLAGVQNRLCSRRGQHLRSGQGAFSWIRRRRCGWFFVM